MIKLQLTDKQAVDLDFILRDLRDHSTLPHTLLDIQEELEVQVDVVLAADSMMGEEDKPDFQLLFRRESRFGLITVYGRRSHYPNWFDKLAFKLPHNKVQVQGEWWHLLPSGWICERHLPRSKKRSKKDTQK